MLAKLNYYESKIKQIPRKKQRIAPLHTEQNVTHPSMSAISSMITLILLILLLAACVIQWFGVAYYLRWLRSFRFPSSENCEMPKAAIVMSLRGADPTLLDCLDRLRDQDYPAFEIHIVIDHKTDNANEIVANWSQENPSTPLHIHLLHEISPKAYLKTSAVRQCLKQLSPEIFAAAMVDSDTVVHKQWLRDLVRPMLNSDVGLVTGNRWYDPTQRSWGSRVRFIYNAWSIAPMLLMRATWGGSLALRKDVFQQEFFFDRMWDTSSEESAMQDATRHANLKLEVQPDVIMLDRDSIDLVSCFRFMRRQLLWTRLYHGQWSQVLLGTIATYVLLASATVFSVVLMCLGYFMHGAVIAIGILTVTATNLSLLIRLHRAIATRIEPAQDVRFPNLDWSSACRLLPAIPLALITYVLATIAAAFATQVQWRGITYRVRPPLGLDLVEYQPYKANAN